MCSQAAPEENLKPFELRFTVRAWPSSSCRAFGAGGCNSCPVRPVSFSNIHVLHLIAENSCRKEAAERHVGGMGFIGNEYGTTFISCRNNYFLP